MREIEEFRRVLREAPEVVRRYAYLDDLERRARRIWEKLKEDCRLDAYEVQWFYTLLRDLETVLQEECGDNRELCEKYFRFIADVNNEFLETTADIIMNHCCRCKLDVEPCTLFKMKR